MTYNLVSPGSMKVKFPLKKNPQDSLDVYPTSKKSAITLLLLKSICLLFHAKITKLINHHQRVLMINRFLRQFVNKWYLLVVQMTVLYSPFCEVNLVHGDENRCSTCMFSRFPFQNVFLSIAFYFSALKNTL